MESATAARASAVVRNVNALIGKTDARGETVTDGHVKPEDFYASIAHATGIDASKTFYTGQGRPIQLVYKDGRVVKDLFA